MKPGTTKQRNPEQRSSETRNGGSSLIFFFPRRFPSTRTRAHARDPNVAKWLEVRKRLADELGRDVFEAWFDKVTVAGIANSIGDAETADKIRRLVHREQFPRAHHCNVTGD